MGVDCQVANAGIGGHSARHGLIVLPRSMLSMPDPDLVCIMYGANDCKAANPPFEKTGFSEAAFARNLEALVDQVRRLTGGQADVMLLSGVPRLDKPGGTTSGAVEAIVGAVRRVASEKKTAFCDTVPAFLSLTAAEKQQFYLDTIHQTQAGLEFIGKLVFESLANPSSP
jgi:lysophospholipase L1-like esterase